MNRIFNRVALGGTFDELHIGHITMLSKAFEIGNNVIIGITTDKYVSEYKSNIKLNNTYNKRLKNITEFLKEFFYNRNYTVIGIDNEYGPTIYDPTIDALITSEETLKNGIKINELRLKNKIKPLTIITLKMILGDDGKPITSTRIRLGQIDKIGRSLK